jgi:hypothetical protein
VAGDFFKSVPTGGDAYILAQIIHDWRDTEALAILGTCAQAMKPGARIWLVEQVVDARESAPSPTLALLDLTMLVLFGAQERTSDEYGELLAAAGFVDVATRPTDNAWAVVEATKP